MALVRSGRPVRLQLKRDLLRNIKRGHAWLYSNAITHVEAPPGSVAILSDSGNRNQIASGIYSPDHALPLRLCRTQTPWTLDDAWFKERFVRAMQHRASLFDSRTTGFRLIAGEGDLLPGLIVDVYDQTAVLKLDGGAPEAFYRPEDIAKWLVTEQLPISIERALFRPRGRGRAGQVVAGPPIEQPVSFRENGLEFTADVVAGQKTGFFLDQRDNRDLVRRISRHKSVLNLFSFNGGFSVAAGASGANQVVSVDIAPAAIEACDDHWLANGLTPDRHSGVTSDCFEFLESALQEKQQWDIVICDPPSFAPNEKSVPQALAAYGKLAQLAARATRSNGQLALASCSSHIDRQSFLEINIKALGKARRRATLLADLGLPADHPTPLAMPELRYLKFLLLQLD